LFFQHQLADATQNLRPQDNRRVSPKRQGGGGGGDGATRLAGAHIRHMANDLAGRGIIDGETGASIGVYPCAINEGLDAE